MKNKSKLFVSRPQIASRLIGKGIQPLEIVENPYHIGYRAWIFKNTPETEQIIRDFYASLNETGNADNG